MSAPARAIIAAAAAAVAVAASGAAFAGDADLLAVRARYLPAAQATFDAGADGLQARYDAARDLEEAVRGVRVTTRCAGLRAALLRYARAQVTVAEAGDYPVPRPKPRLPGAPSACTAARGRVPPAVVAPAVSLPRLSLPTRSQVARPEGATDGALAARLAAIGGSYPGWAGFWVHDLRTGRTAGWNSDARFAAGSAVKLAPLVAAVAHAPLAYDAAQVAHWSSNLGANRIVSQLGTWPIGDALRRLGMWSSTYPGLYRAGTSARIDAPKPPPAAHARVTTAHDLGRALYRIHAAAIGNRLALRQLGLSRRDTRVVLALLLGSRPVGDNRGLVRPTLPAATIAQKNAWISDLRTTAAIVYGRDGPTIVVVEVSRPGVTSSEAVQVGAQVVRAAGLDRTS